MATPVATVTDTSGFTPAQQAAFNSAAALSGGLATNTTDPSKVVNSQTAIATPTPVVSTQPAQQAVQGMQNTLTQAQQDLANQQSIKAANAANEKAGLVPSGSGTSSTFVPPSPPAVKTPEQELLDQPPDDSTWVYNANGDRAPLKNGSPMPAGYTANNPKTRPVSDQVTTSAGTTFQKYADGTYGTLDANGNYIGPANAQDFTNAKGLNDTISQMDQLKNGTYPLTPSQQAQLDGLKAQFAGLIKLQETANANLTGGTTVAENLYGMGNSLTGMGEIKGTIDSGLAKIADLNSKMASAVATMQQAFMDNDLKLLTATYGIYSDAVKARQENIDKMKDAATAAAKDLRDYNEKVKEFNQGEQDKVTAAIGDVQSSAAEGGAPASVLAAIGGATNRTDAINAAGQYLQASKNPDVAQYLAYSNETKATGKTPVPFESWQSAQEFAKAKSSASGALAGEGYKTSADKAYADAYASARGAAAGTASVMPTGGTVSQSAQSRADFPQQLQPYAQKSASGAWYIDLSHTSASSRDKLAAMAGANIPIISDPNQAADLKNQSDAIAKLNIIAKAMGDINSPSAMARDFGGAGLTKASILAQTDPKAAAASALNDSALDILKAISGVQGFRGNKEAVDQIRDALPTPTDTQDVAAQKLQYVAAQIQAREESIIGTQGPIDTTTFIIRSEDQAQQALITAGKKDSTQQTQIASVLNTTNPTTGQPYTYTEAAQILGIDIPAASKSGGGGWLSSIFPNAFGLQGRSAF